MKMLNDLSLAQERHRLCGEEWIFQQDNAAIHIASITKKYPLEQKIRLLDYPACSPDFNPIENLWLLIVAKSMKEVDSTLWSHVTLRATYRWKFLMDLLVRISVSTLRCSTHWRVGEELIRTSLGSGWVERQLTLSLLLADQLLQ